MGDEARIAIVTRLPESPFRIKERPLFTAYHSIAAVRSRDEFRTPLGVRKSPKDESRGPVFGMGI
jgi:hypothetical protein